MTLSNPFQTAHLATLASIDQLNYHAKHTAVHSASAFHHHSSATKQPTATMPAMKVPQFASKKPTTARAFHISSGAGTESASTSQNSATTSTSAATRAMSRASARVLNTYEPPTRASCATELSTVGTGAMSGWTTVVARGVMSESSSVSGELRRNFVKMI
jgi:hypothetical protein